MNYKTMSVAELAKLRDEVQSALVDRIRTERSELQNRIAALGAFEGSGDAAPAQKKRRGRPPKDKRQTPSKSPLAGRRVPAKYRSPNGETWTGRGRPPNWLAKLEARGTSRESLLIK